MAILPLALAGVSFVRAGETLLGPLDLELGTCGTSVVVGPNGAGKSLLLRLCHGLLTPSAGRVRWCGADAGSAAQRQAMVFQQPVVLRRSVLANVDYALALRGLPRRERQRRAAEALALAGLEALARRPAHVLSGGERQRLALARVWALRPEVLFLDEPTASLDPAATAAVEALIGRFRLAGTVVVMTTHDLGQARRLADEVLFLYRGQVRERAPAAAFFAAPACAEAQAFVRGELLW